MRLWNGKLCYGTDYISGVRTLRKMLSHDASKRSTGYIKLNERSEFFAHHYGGISLHLLRDVGIRAAL